MKNNASLLYSFSLVVGDFLALIVAFAGAYILRVSISHRPVAEAVSAITYIELFLLLLPFWILLFAIMGLYSSSIYEKRFAEGGHLLVGSFLGLLFVTGVDFFSNTAIFPAKLVPVYGFVLAFVFLLIFRNIIRWLRGLLFGYDVGITNVLIVGDTQVAEELMELLKDRRSSGYRIVGGVTGKQHQGGRYHGYTTYSSFEEAAKRAHVHDLHAIIQTELYASNEKNNEILEFAQTHHISYRFVPGNSELFVGKLEVELFRASVPVINVHQTALIGWGRVVKRVFDIIVATLLLLITSPLILLITLLLLLSGGRVFFRQERLTRYNEVFRVFKFRTHKIKYEGTTPEQAFAIMGRPELAEKYRENGDHLPNDPRVTRLGKFLRRTSLDELPQFFNILKGDISLVGPRPLIPQELNVYEKRHMILSVKSGLTGLAQVSGRRNINFNERRTIDTYYVQNWSFWMDMVILFKTIRVVLRGDGAK